MNESESSARKESMPGFEKWRHPIYTLKHSYTLHHNESVTTGSVFSGMSVNLDSQEVDQKYTEQIDELRIYPKCSKPKNFLDADTDAP